MGLLAAGIMASTPDPVPAEPYKPKALHARSMAVETRLPLPHAVPTYGAPQFKAVAKPEPRTRIRTGSAAVATTDSPRPAKPSKSHSVPSNSRSILAIAASLVGIYYVYGGTTTAGFDCSGFTQYVYRKAGISIPRTADAQRRGARRISNPRLGDLVFFGSPAYHVGIYAGNNMMYDSPRTGKAVSLRKIWSSNITYGTYR